MENFKWLLCPTLTCCFRKSSKHDFYIYDPLTCFFLRSQVNKSYKDLWPHLSFDVFFFSWIEIVYFNFFEISLRSKPMNTVDILVLSHSKSTPNSSIHRLQSVGKGLFSRWLSTFTIALKIPSGLGPTTLENDNDNKYLITA